MKFSAILAVALASVAAATPLSRREVPQEHSHERILKATRALVQQSKETVAQIDVVFGKLGDGAINKELQAKNLAGGAINPTCLQQQLADACVTVAAGNKDEIATCLQYRVLERNTGGVGTASALCTETPKNKELVGLTQLQDPASADGKANNAKIQTDLAKALVTAGFTADEAADLALQTSTFGPGKIGDPTARGLSCDGFDNLSKQEQAAPEDFDFFGFAVKKGDLVDCITFATITNGESKAVESISKTDLLTALGGAGGNNDNNNNNTNNNNGGNKGGNVDAKKVTEAEALLEKALALLEKL
ncbi:hypothetical protein HDU97_000115 [Phlyctochytrium planicorne]|nr:hypothetical protein HDU97_000115 [Phlyctochytrium planicorne]